LETKLVYSLDPKPEPSRNERGQTLGLVTKITGSSIVVTGQIDNAGEIIGIGGLIKVCGYRDVIGIINSTLSASSTRWSSRAAPASRACSR
jgi:hypothetical protein